MILRHRARIDVVIDGRRRRVDLEPDASGRTTVRVDGRLVAVDLEWIDPDTLVAIADGVVHRVTIEPRDAAGLHVLVGPRRFDIVVDGRRDSRNGRGSASGTHGAASGVVKAPMPGRVVRVLVAPGERVTAGQGVVVVEAMKMENELRTPRDGTVADVRVREGAAVEAGTALVVID